MDELKPTGFETADALDRFRAVQRGQTYKILFPSDLDEAIEALEEKLNRRPAPENKPLTLEQLRQMDGEPVWIKGSDAKTSGWALIKGKREKQIANCPDDWNISYYMKDYGKTWLAYSRKLEKEAASC